MRAALLCAAALLLPRPGSSHQRPDPQAANLADLGIEDLMKMEVRVTSASRKAESLAGAPAAIFVLRSEDIRRGGFTSLPEALRMVPGLSVDRVNAHWWAISARGFNDYLNNKLLVLVDGRSVYTPHFGGVFWELQDLPLEDVERIEVIRGPGGALWGADAVNGVINIVTRSAFDTQGFSFSASAGFGHAHAASVRYGGRVGERLAYRIFGKAGYWEPGLDAAGAGAYDFWNLSQGGLRMEWRLSRKDTLSAQAVGYEGRLQAEIPYFSGPGVHQALLPNSYVVRGGHTLGRWRRTLARGSLDVLGYCDWNDRLVFIDSVRNACRVEFQHDLPLGDRQVLSWGGGVDSAADTLYESFGNRGVPARQRNTTPSAFVQHDLAVVPDRLRLMMGAKFERHPYTGFEVQPQVRGVWTPSRQHALWAALSRAVRPPNRYENSEEIKFVLLPGALPTYLTAVGNPRLEAEVLTAWEFGYRYSPLRSLALDATLYYNQYSNLVMLNLVDPRGVAGAPRVNRSPLYAELLVPWQNLGPGQTHGAELVASFRPVSRWLLSAAFTELRGNSVNFNDTLNLPLANSRRHQVNLQSRVDVTPYLEFDSSLYYYNGIPVHIFNGARYQDVPAHNRVDAGLTFHRRSGFTLSIWGHDLGAPAHWENRPTLFTTSGSQVRGQRVSIRLQWQSSAREQP